MKRRTWGRFEQRPFYGGYDAATMAWLQLNRWGRVCVGWYSASQWLS